MADENVKRGMVCATIGALSWGLSGTCGQYLFMHYTIDALLLTNIRMLGAGIVLMILVISLQRHTLTALLHNRRDMAQLAAFSVLGLVTCQLTYLSAIQYANSGTATVLQSLNVALMSCIAAIRFRRWPDRWQMIAIFLALAGVFLIATGGQIQTMVISPQGLFWGIGAAIGSILYTVLPHKQIRKCTGYAHRRHRADNLPASLADCHEPRYGRNPCDCLYCPDWHGSLLHLVPARRRRYRSGQSYVYRHS